MRIAVFLSCVLSAYGLGALSGRVEFTDLTRYQSMTCDQLVYDQIYRHMVVSALESDLSHGAFKARNDGIETLRTLCKGQKSTVETR